MRTWLILAAALVAPAAPAYGHHSFALSYLEDQSVSIA